MSAFNLLDAAYTVVNLIEIAGLVALAVLVCTGVWYAVQAARTRRPKTATGSAPSNVTRLPYVRAFDFEVDA